VDAVKRFGEVAGQGICGGDGAGAGAEGCYGSVYGRGLARPHRAR
jgi:hypothetical protein